MATPGEDNGTPEAVFSEAQLQTIAGLLKGMLDKALEDRGAQTNAGSGQADKDEATAGSGSSNDKETSGEFS